LTRHLKTHAHLQSKNLPCLWKDCNKVFTDDIQLRTHVLEDHLTPDEEERSSKTSCPWTGCNFVASSTTGKTEDNGAEGKAGVAKPLRKDAALEEIYEHVMKEHMHWTVETPERVIACHWGHCGRFFADKTKFAEHIKAHAGIKNVACVKDGCEKVFTNEAQMRTHIKRSHSQGFACPDCDRTYTTAFNLREHRKVAHLNCEYVCPTCSKKYKSSKAFHVHKRRCGEANPVKPVSEQQPTDNATPSASVQSVESAADAQSPLVQLGWYSLAAQGSTLLIGTGSGAVTLAALPLMQQQLARPSPAPPPSSAPPTSFQSSQLIQLAMQQQLAQPPPAPPPSFAPPTSFQSSQLVELAMQQVSPKLSPRVSEATQPGTQSSPTLSPRTRVASQSLAVTNALLGFGTSNMAQSANVANTSLGMQNVAESANVPNDQAGMHAPTAQDYISVPDDDPTNREWTGVGQ